MNRLLVILIIAIFSFSGCTTHEVKKPNIIFFIADDMYPEMFNCLPQGAEKNLTPNIDKLAKEGVLMENQYVVSPVCTPSRYNCLTGNFASRATNNSFLNKTNTKRGKLLFSGILS